MTPGPRFSRRPGSIIGRLPAFGFPVGLPFVFPPAFGAREAPSAGPVHHQPLGVAAIPADVVLVIAILGALGLAFAVLAIIRRRRRFEAGDSDGRRATSDSRIGGDASMPVSGSRDPLVSLMTRPSAGDRGGRHVPAGRFRVPGDEATWVRRLDRPGRHDGDRGA